MDAENPTIVEPVVPPIRHRGRPRKEPSQITETPTPAPVKIQMQETEDTAMKDLLAIAAKAQERYLKAPNLAVAEQTKDEMQELVRMYAPECLGPHATHHAYFCLTKDLALAASRAYTPKLDRGMPIHWNEVTLTTIPLAIFKARESAAQEESRKRMRQCAETAGAGKNFDKGEPSSVKGLEVEEFSITTESVGGNK